MLKKILTTLLYGGCALALLTSCGSSKASGTGEFATVFATASGPGADVDSDVAKWVDSTGASVAACSTSGPNFTPDNVTFTITTTAYNTANTGQTSPIQTSNLTIRKVSMTLTPADPSVTSTGTLITTPALPASLQTQYGSASVATGGEVTLGANSVNVRFATDQLKAFLFHNYINCSNPVLFSYWAVVSFTAQEVTTGREATITAAPIKVNFADFPDTTGA
jgi:hypothetical protein